MVGVKTNLVYHGKEFQNFKPIIKQPLLTEKVTNAFLQMKKFDIERIVNHKNK